MSIQIEAEQPLAIFKNVNDEKIETQADLLQKIPKFSRQTPYLIVGSTPITRAARELAKQRDLKEHAIEFHKTGRKNRDWQPWSLPPQVIDEIKELGPKLSETTMKAWDVFTWTELRVGSFTSEGLRMIDDSLYRGMMIGQWHGEERKHAIITSEGLYLSGRKSETEIARMVAEAEANPWKPSDHNGLKHHYGYIGYGAIQEKITNRNYIKGLRTLIRFDYGLPQEKTTAEIARGFETGLCEPIRKIAGDESAHHMAYLRQLQILAKYFPYEVYDVMQNVTTGFKMPLMEIVPHSEEVGKLIYPGGDREYAKFYIDTVDGISQELGLAGRKKIQTVSETAAVLKEVFDPQILKINKNGTFEPATEYQDILLSLQAA